MRWVGHVTCMADKRNAYSFWSENLKGRHHSEDRAVDGKIMLEWI